jgi:hypothetical protein
MTVPVLVMTGSDKGGVGKTTIARALLDFLKENGVRPSVFDTEPDPGVLRRFYKTAKSVDVGVVRGQMQVFDEVESAGFTFVDIKAGGLSKVLTAMRDAGLLKDVHAGKMRMIVVHVLGSTEASLREIAAAGAVLDEGGEHILVKNHATDGQFFEWDKETLIRSSSPDSRCSIFRTLMAWRATRSTRRLHRSAKCFSSSKPPTLTSSEREVFCHERRHCRAARTVASGQRRRDASHGNPHNRICRHPPRTVGGECVHRNCSDRSTDSGYAPRTGGDRRAANWATDMSVFQQFDAARLAQIQ